MVKLYKIAYLREKISFHGFTHKGIHYLVSPNHIFSLEDRVTDSAIVRTVATAPEGEKFATYDGNLALRFGQIWVRLESGAIMNPFDKKEAAVDLPPGREVVVAGNSFTEQEPGVFKSNGMILSYTDQRLSNELFNIGKDTVVAKGIHPYDNTLFYLDGKVFREFPGAIKNMVPFYEEESQYLVTSERSGYRIFRLDGSVYWEPKGEVISSDYFNQRTYVRIKEYSSGGVNGLFDIKTKQQMFDLTGISSRSIDLFMAWDALCGLNLRDGEYTGSRDLLIHHKGNFRRETLKVPVAVISNCNDLLLGENGRTVYKLFLE